tara:strand:+ start:177 stop:380 length:204 start_codon:yes stop_codon:yes gene_type:complete
MLSAIGAYQSLIFNGMHRDATVFTCASTHPCNFIEALQAGIISFIHLGGRRANRTTPWKKHIHNLIN